MYVYMYTHIQSVHTHTVCTHTYSVYTHIQCVHTHIQHVHTHTVCTHTYSVYTHKQYLLGFGAEGVCTLLQLLFQRPPLRLPSLEFVRICVSHVCIMCTHMYCVITSIVLFVYMHMYTRSRASSRVARSSRPLYYMYCVICIHTCTVLFVYIHMHTCSRSSSRAARSSAPLPTNCLPSACAACPK